MTTNPLTLYFRNGSIRTEGINLHEIELTWWRSQIGLVQQDPFLFNDTILRNLELGLVGTECEHTSAQTKRQLIEQACREAYAHDFITALPEGYETQVGDNGIKLSGGQQQRIAIARSIVKNPKILIFDEATSALDVASERLVQDALEKVSHNRTTIVIAHRLSTIQRADNIMVLAKGTVIQQGTHDSLLADRAGAYWKLVHAQQLVQEVEQKQSSSLWEGFLSEKRLSIRTSIVSEMDMTTPIDVQFTPTEAARPIKGIEGRFFHSFGLLMMEQKRNWVWYLVMLLTAAGAGSSYAIQSYLFARLISSFGWWGDYLQKSTNFLCLMLVVVALGVGSCYFVLGWVFNMVSTRTKSLYRKEYFYNMITKSIAFFDEEENSVGTLTARLATDPTQLQQLLGMNMAMAFISIFNVIGCITISVYFGWKFALVVIAASMPIILGCGYYRVRHEVKFESRNNEVFAESAKFATEAIRAIRTVAALTLEKTISAKYKTLLGNHIKTSFMEARYSMILFAASDSLVLLCMAFALWYGGTLLSTFEYLPFNFFVIYYAILQWLSFGPNIAQVTAAATRIHNMRDGRSHPHQRASTRPTRPDTAVSARYIIPLTAIQHGADICFRDVSFSYPTQSNPVLRGISFTIRHGQFAAFVGPSGSGKTTIISLLERFYEPQHGSILYNSDNIRFISLRRHRDQLSLVAQEPSLFRGSIRSNILLGVNERHVTEPELHRACRDAGIHDFITSLPQGYETDVGTSGVALSGGQKQRLSIAHALIRDPSALLLDEATSSLDSETEREVQKVFEQTASGRTMIVVAHRLATVQRAGVIFVLHDGKIVERGNHQSLLAGRGWYWQMVSPRLRHGDASHSHNHSVKPKPCFDLHKFGKSVSSLLTCVGVRPTPPRSWPRRQGSLSHIKFYGMQSLLLRLLTCPSNLPMSLPALLKLGKMVRYPTLSTL
ncbi:P-loop containing nucleoside triphosphate hydrolase protein [Bimuria novae-zelandiae CBS 107.79]|uniref:P-loop containing nucleoside triphosphate hydrolase protein n=1 Tax=Bimuria novae-zelandiae CBS 107.79 TaxID=1447943 RepID=A0A6A5UVC4_9PLEO|nr:P-loop containing nucleoside triphosphate hydrolase protein [Bimuria novae-zelandiae CBS 107.79]